MIRMADSYAKADRSHRVDSTPASAPTSDIRDTHIRRLGSSKRDLLIRKATAGGSALAYISFP
jgi:hypothetical protein